MQGIKYEWKLFRKEYYIVSGAAEFMTVRNYLGIYLNIYLF